MADEGLYLGALSDGGGRALLDPDHLTTHAVCLGMTGSGKTGLGIVALEELARRRVPLLVIDLKGDMVNLLLNFPSLEGRDFAPWLPADVVEDGNRAAAAETMAERWRDGLAGSDLGGEQMSEARDGLHWQVLTPGVASAAPLDILPSLSLPPGVDFEGDLDGVHDRVNGVVSALLSLIGRGGDPLTDRDHVLLATVLLEHWRLGESVDLQRLLSSVVDPPVANLGALPVEIFFPRDERMKLVLELNTLIASPAFSAWTKGVPLSMETLLGTPAEPRGTVLCLAHLDERQRRFVLALVTAELVAWMRSQPASSGLRALLYIDEVQGILPPHPANPPTKGPLLTLLKQGRAFGVGAWLATQNPVDLDYKALGNAGVKVIGRLITERDRQRALEGLGASAFSEGVDTDGLVAGLAKRQFVMADVRAKQRVQVFSSRWAMSYLRGPVVLSELEPLLESAPAVGGSTESPGTRSEAVSEGSKRPPVLTTEVDQRYVAGTSGMAAPEVVLHCQVTVRKAPLKLDRVEREVWRIPLDSNGLDLVAGELMSFVDDLIEQPPEGMLFPQAAPAGLDEDLDGLQKTFIRHRARQPVMVLANAKLKMAAEIGEEREAFIERCLEVADRADDRQQGRVKKKFERRIESLKRRLAKERDELTRDQNQLEARKAEEKLGMVEGLFSILLGSRSLRSAAGKAATKAKSAASKRRMRQGAEGRVVESENEIERLTTEIEDLALEMEEEIDNIAAVSEDIAVAVEEIPVRATQTGIAVTSIELVWAPA